MEQYIQKNLCWVEKNLFSHSPTKFQINRTMIFGYTMLLNLKNVVLRKTQKKKQPAMSGSSEPFQRVTVTWAIFEISMTSAQNILKTSNFKKNQIKFSKITWRHGPFETRDIFKFGTGDVQFFLDF